MKLQKDQLLQDGGWGRVRGGVGVGAGWVGVPGKGAEAVVSFLPCGKSKISSKQIQKPCLREVQCAKMTHTMLLFPWAWLVLMQLQLVILCQVLLVQQGRSQ